MSGRAAAQQQKGGSKPSFHSWSRSPGKPVSLTNKSHYQEERRRAQEEAKENAQAEEEEDREVSFSLHVQPTIRFVISTLGRNVK